MNAEAGPFLLKTMRKWHERTGYPARTVVRRHAWSKPVRVDQLYPNLRYAFHSEPNVLPDFDTTLPPLEPMWKHYYQVLGRDITQGTLRPRCASRRGASAYQSDGTADSRSASRQTEGNPPEDQPPTTRARNPPPLLCKTPPPIGPPGAYPGGMATLVPRQLCPPPPGLNELPPPNHGGALNTGWNTSSKAAGYAKPRSPPPRKYVEPPVVERFGHDLFAEASPSSAIPEVTAAVAISRLEQTREPYIVAEYRDVAIRKRWHQVVQLAAFNAGGFSTEDFTAYLLADSGPASRVTAVWGDAGAGHKRILMPEWRPFQPVKDAVVSGSCAIIEYVPPIPPPDEEADSSYPVDPESTIQRNREINLVKF